MSALIESMPEAEYHADPREVPSLSASIANVLLSKSPRHAYMAHPKLGGIGREATATMDRGSLMHRLVLGAGPPITCVEAEDWRTKAAREQRDEARAAGRIPVLALDLAQARDDAAEVRRQLAAAGIVLDGMSEATALWDDATYDGRPVACRGRVDHWHPQTATIYDLKTCRSAHPVALQRHILGYGYHIQRAAYVRAIETLLPELAGRVKFVFLFVELDPVVTVQPVRLSGSMRELGDRRWARAVDTWAQCLATDTWPSYADGIIEIDAPTWALADDFDAAYAADTKEEDQ